MDDFARRISLQTFEKIINYKFRNISLLDEALTHASFSHEHKLNFTYERMEVLGDSLLGFIVVDHIYRTHRGMNEGEITKIKSSVVSEPSLARAATRLGVPDFIQLGRGEEHTGGRHRASMLADVFEAIACAIYLDGGELPPVRDFIIGALGDDMERAAGLEHGADNFKSLLQEYALRHFGVKPEYKLLETRGPEHDKTFVVAVEINEIALATGTAKSRKEAEQLCAQNAYRSITEIDGRTDGHEPPR